MGVSINGTTIPTDGTGSIVYNGVSLTNLVFNGTTVWTKNSLPTWSGSTLATYSSTGSVGILTSGNSYQYNGGGSWGSVSRTTGFSGNSVSFENSAANREGIIVSGFTMTIQLGPCCWDSTQVETFVTWNPSTGAFTGTGTFSDPYYGYNNNIMLQTSSGLLRANADNPFIRGMYPVTSFGYGAWVSLT